MQKRIHANDKRPQNTFALHAADDHETDVHKADVHEPVIIDEHIFVEVEGTEVVGAWMEAPIA